MATIQRFEDLEVWKKGREISVIVFKLTKSAEFSRDFSLKDQIMRSSGSVMDNIAEGFDRGGNKEFINFLTISKGSLAEVQSQTYRAYDFGYISLDDFNELIKETTSLSERIGKFISYLKNSDMKGTNFKRSNNEEK